MSNSKINVLLARIERRVEQEKDAVRADVHTRFHSDGTDLGDEVANELQRHLVEDERRGLTLPLRDVIKMVATLKTRLGDSEPPLNPLEHFSLNMLALLLNCGEPVLSKVDVTAEFGPVTLTHQQPLDSFKRGLQMSLVQSALGFGDVTVSVEDIKLLQHQFTPVDDATGFLKTAQLVGRVKFTASMDGTPEQLEDAVNTLLLTLRHRVEAMQPARVSMRHFAFENSRTV